MNFTVEKLKPENLTDVIEIGDAFAKEVKHPGGFSFKAFETYWSPAMGMDIGEIFVIRDGNRIAGLLGTAFVADWTHSGEMTAYENFWFVLPEYRSEGLASKLFDAFEREAKKRRCKKILMVHLEGPFSSRLEAFYIHRGYHLVEKTFGKEI